MEYTLMHKNVSVLDIDLDEAREFAILSAFSSRLRNLMTLSEVQCPMDNIEQDVQQDTVQNYGLKKELRYGKHL